jgi:hypothetical protein
LDWPVPNGDFPPTAAPYDRHQHQTGVGDNPGDKTMFAKTTMALSAALVFSLASAASAATKRHAPASAAAYQSFGAVSGGTVTAPGVALRCTGGACDPYNHQQVKCIGGACSPEWGIGSNN